MKILDSIFKTIESIKKKHTYFKIKVSSIKLDEIEYSEHDNLLQILSTYKVRQLIISGIRN